MTRSEFRGSIALGAMILILLGCITLRRCSGQKSGSDNPMGTDTTEAVVEVIEVDSQFVPDTIASPSTDSTPNSRNTNSIGIRERKKSSRRKPHTAPPPDLASPHDRPVPTSR